MAKKWIVVNADSSLAVDPKHPYSDTATPSKDFDSQGKAEAFAVMIGGGMPRCTKGCEGEAKHQAREVK